MDNKPGYSHSKINSPSESNCISTNYHVNSVSTGDHGSSNLSCTIQHTTASTTTHLTVNAISTKTLTNTPVNPPLKVGHVTHTTRSPQITVNPTKIIEQHIQPINNFNNEGAIKNHRNPDNNFITSEEAPSTSFSNSNNVNNKPGCAFIFNHESFDNPHHDDRVGSKKDTERLEKTFEEYGMQVEVYTNCTVEHIKRTIDIISNVDYTSHACLVIVLLSHGNRNDIIYAKNGTYSINDDMLYPILLNPTLHGKPKIFFVQACKGHKNPSGVHTDSPGSEAIHTIDSPNNFTTANEVLKFYSTFEGYVAQRKSNGSVFIHTLCRYLKEYGYVADISEIIKKVIANVKEQTRDEQIPSLTTTLTKPFTFGDYVRK